MNLIKRLIKLLFSEFVISKISSVYYGWHGDYHSWSAAKSRSSGYDDIRIFNKVLDTARRVRKGEIEFERDSVPFTRVEHSFPLLAGLLWIANRKSRVSLIDFGGSLGTSYYQNIKFLDSLAVVNWCVVEQPHYVKAGKEEFTDGRLQFCYSIEDCISINKIDAILLSNVIQYLENPYEFIEKVISYDFEYIIIDRTILLKGDNDRLTIQRVPPKIYRADYCCWLLSESKLLGRFFGKYDLIWDYDIPGTINIRSLFKGYLFRRKYDQNMNNGATD
jgi:putative methyltransferase (TIGR04325 family)